MKTSRRIGFIIAILIGIAGGLAYGWFYHPAQMTTSTLQELRADYKADYVLMVSEVYAAEGDLPAATVMLKKLQPGNPQVAVQKALQGAKTLGFKQWEMKYMQNLQAALKAQALP